MTVRAQIMKEIVDRMGNIPDDQLGRILSYIQKIESLTEKKKSILSYAGTWKNLDKELFSEYTNKLHKNRLEESDQIIE